MSEYWKSNAKKYCDYCKVWISDNKASINIHESGKNHKDSVKAKLEDIKKRTNEKKAEENKASKAMAAIERAAMAAMEKDLSSNPKLRHQYGKQVTEAAIAASFEIPDEPEKKETKPTIKKKPKPSSVEKTKQAIKRKIDPEQEAKIGKWERIVEKKPVVETNVGGFIDLQLPNSSGLIATKFENTIENQFENETIEEKPKPKWNPIGFQSIDVETNEIKVEPVEVEQKEIKTEIESVSNLFESVVEKKEHQIEKVVTLDGMFKSNKKPVAFKKRKNDTIQLRQKTDD